MRPWVFGSQSTSLLETREARRYPIEFDGPGQYRDDFEITLPEGYEVDELTAPMSRDVGFAVYQSKTERAGRALRYSRTLEIKQLSVAAENSEQLKKFYREIYADERRVVVLQPSAH